MTSKPQPIRWDERKMTVQTGDGPREVAAWVRGNLAVHETVTLSDFARAKWCVSHVPTGLRFPAETGEASTRERAQALALALERVVPSLAEGQTVEEVTAVAEQLARCRPGWGIDVLGMADALTAESAAAADPQAALYRAVDYVLRRAQEDPDLGYVLGPMTEAHRLLCLAEAAHTGRPLEEVERERGQDLQPEHSRRRPRVIELEELVQELERFRPVCAGCGDLLGREDLEGGHDQCSSCREDGAEDE
jgi:hypothetical protein